MLRDVTEQRRAEAATLERQRLQATLHEREQLRELHDSIGQVFGFANLKVGAARKLMADGKLAKADDQLATVEHIVAGAHADLREYILNLRVGRAISDPSWRPSASTWTATARTTASGSSCPPARGIDDGVLSVDAQLQLFRILQRRCPIAQTRPTDCVWVSFEKTAGPAIRMRIRDAGQGFDPLKPAGVGPAPAPGGHFGLGFIRERAEQLGGALRIESAPGQGTCVTVEVPVGPGRGDGGARTRRRGARHGDRENAGRGDWERKRWGATYGISGSWMYTGPRWKRLWRYSS